MLRRIIGFALAAALAAPVLGQYGGGQAGGAIKWGGNIEQAMQQARETHLPLMLWVKRGSSSRDEDKEDVERDLNKAFRNPAVVEMSRRFIPCTMPNRPDTRPQLDKWGVRPTADLELVFVTPGLERLDSISPDGAAAPANLIQKMALVFNDYRGKLYDKELKPKLEDEKSSAKELKAALELVNKFIITQADEAVLKILKREKLDPGTERECLEVLGTLSTDKCADELFARAAEDKRAAKALDDLTPVAAEHLLAKLWGEDREAHVRAYHAVTKICKISNVKPDRFWEGTNAKLLEEEVERVKKLVTQAAKRWKERYEQYR